MELEDRVGPSVAADDDAGQRRPPRRLKQRPCAVELYLLGCCCCCCCCCNRHRHRRLADLVEVSNCWWRSAVVERARTWPEVSQQLRRHRLVQRQHRDFQRRQRYPNRPIFRWCCAAGGERRVSTGSCWFDPPWRRHLRLRHSDPWRSYRSLYCSTRWADYRHSTPSDGRADTAAAGPTPATRLTVRISATAAASLATSVVGWAQLNRDPLRHRLHHQDRKTKMSCSYLVAEWTSDEPSSSACCCSLYHRPLRRRGGGRCGRCVCSPSRPARRQTLPSPGGSLRPNRRWWTAWSVPSRRQPRLHHPVSFQSRTVPFDSFSSLFEQRKTSLALLQPHGASPPSRRRHRPLDCCHWNSISSDC